MLRLSMHCFLLQLQHRVPQDRGEWHNPVPDQRKPDQVPALSDLVSTKLKQVGNVCEQPKAKPLQLPAVLAVKHVPQLAPIDLATQHTARGLVGARMYCRHIDYRRNTQN